MEKESPHGEREIVVDRRRNSQMKTSKENSSQEEGELSPKDELLNNGNGAEGKVVTRHSNSDDSDNSRFFH